MLTVNTEGKPAEAWVVGFIVYQGGPEAKSPSRDDHEEPILKSVGKTWNCSIYSSRAVVGGQEELVVGGMGKSSLAQSYLKSGHGSGPLVE